MRPLPEQWLVVLTHMRLIVEVSGASWDSVVACVCPWGRVEASLYYHCVHWVHYAYGLGLVSWVYWVMGTQGYPRAFSRQ